jgi:hypothetical protein
MLKLIIQCGSDVALPFFHLDLAAVDTAEHLILPALRPAIAHAAAAGEALVHLASADRDVVVCVLRHNFLNWLIMSTGKRFGGFPLLPLPAGFDVAAS